MEKIVVVVDFDIDFVGQLVFEWVIVCVQEWLVLIELFIVIFIVWGLYGDDFIQLVVLYLVEV